MKVLFAGTAGVRKSQILKKIRDTIKAADSEYLVFDTDKWTSQKEVPVLDRLLYGTNPTVFLRLPCKAQRQRWKETFRDIRTQFFQATPFHHFLGVHMTYRFMKVPICVTDFTQLIQWEPDCIITLIDDAFYVRQRIHNGGYESFKLDELFLWRMEEILCADLLARVFDPPKPNFLFAIKHPVDTLVRLLLNFDESVRVYTSYQITETRQIPELRNEIDEFRRKIHDQEHLVVFDPLSIDELPPMILASNAENKSGIFTFDPQNPAHRWPLSEDVDLLDSGLDLKDHLPLKIPTAELLDAKESAKIQIMNRDIRLIDQSHCLVVYRPTISGNSKLSTGVQAELEHAAHTECRVIWYIKEGTDPLPESPFVPTNPGYDPDFIYNSSDEKFWERIAELPSLIDRKRDNFLA